MEGTHALRGEGAVYAAGYLMVLACTRSVRQRLTPELDLERATASDFKCLPLS